MEPTEQTFFEHLQAIYLSDLTYRDFFIPGALFFWSMLLVIHLRQIDCYHLVTAATYVVFCIAAGVFEVVALPSVYHEGFSVPVTLLLIFMFTALATLRWLRMIHLDQPKVISSKRVAKGKLEDGK